MLSTDLKPFQFNEIDNLCISARMRIESDSRIKVIRDVAQRLISFSEIPFASAEDAYTELSHQAIKLLAREGFNSEDKNDVALIIALLATEYRRLPTVDKGLSYEDVFKKCYSSYLDCAKGPASEEQIEQLKAEVDRIVFERSMYNTYLFMEEFINAAFIVMSRVQENREDCARKLASHLDTKRDREAPRGDIWCSMVAKILLKSKSLKDAIEKDFHLDSKEDLHIYDTCHNFKHIDYTDDFLLELFSAFKKNEEEYYIQEIINSPSYIRSQNDHPILVYDRCNNVIKPSFFYSYQMDCVPIYCLGTVNDYVCSFLNVDMRRFSDRLGELYRGVDLFDEDDKQVTFRGCEGIDKAIQVLLNISVDDIIFKKAHIYFVRRWIEYKVNLNLCTRQQFYIDLNNLSAFEYNNCTELPLYERQDFEAQISQYFSEYGCRLGNNFYDYLDFSFPILEQFVAKKSFPREAYCRTLIKYFITRSNEILSDSKTEQIIQVLTKKHSINYYFDTITQILDEIE